MKKKVFLLKMSHRQLNYAVLLFWWILGEIHWKPLFLFKKVTISERSSKILRKITFLNKFEKEKSQRKIWIWCKQLFLFKSVKVDNYEQKLFFSTKLEQTAILCFPVVLKHFRADSLKNSLFSQIYDYLRKLHGNTQKVCFS